MTAAAPVAFPPVKDIEIAFDGGTFRSLEPLSRPGRAPYAGQELAENGNGAGYLKCRRAAETNSSDLWRVHDKMYDLSEYLDVHPGGREWLERMRGCDATEAFEAHHLDGEKVEKVLSLYYVRDVKPDEFNCGNRFDWSDEAFWRVVRKRVLERLLAEAGEGATTMQATAATPAMMTACTMVVAQWAGAFALAAGSSSSLVSTAAALMAGYFQIGTWGVGHNFMHQSDKKAGLWRYVMDLNGGQSSSEFRVTHALSHHLHPNLPNDFEAGHYVGDGRFGFTTPSNSTISNRYTMAAVGAPLMGTFAQGLRAAKALVAGKPRTEVQKGNGTADMEGHRWRDILPAALPFLQLLLLSGFKGSVVQGLWLFVVQGAAYNLSFMPFGLGVHHAVGEPMVRGEGVRQDPHDPHSHSTATAATTTAAATATGAAGAASTAERELLMKQQSAMGSSGRDTIAWREGQPGGEKTADYGQHQVAASTDHSIFFGMNETLTHYLSLTGFGYLNDHTLHHLFPAVDHSKHRVVRAVFEQTCRDFGVDYKIYEAGDVWNGFHLYMSTREAQHTKARL
jgi:hypothetical protein